MRRGLRALAVIAALAIVAFTAHGGGPRDFCTYYTAGLLANEDGAAAAFDLDRLNRRHTELHPDSGRRVGSFYYSPLFLAPAALLARLDFEAAEIANQVLILLALGGILYFVLEAPRPKWLLALLFLAFVLGDPVRIQFLYQNWTAVFVLLVALALRQTLRGRYASAVLFWALAMHLKLYAGLFLVPLWFFAFAKRSGRHGDRPLRRSGAGESSRFGGTRRVALGALAVFFLLLALPTALDRLRRPRRVPRRSRRRSRRRPHRLLQPDLDPRHPRPLRPHPARLGDLEPAGGQLASESTPLVSPWPVSSTPSGSSANSQPKTKARPEPWRSPCPSCCSSSPRCGTTANSCSSPSSPPACSRVASRPSPPASSS